MNADVSHLLDEGSAADVVLSFINALNCRDLSAMLLLVADDCHHEDLSHEEEANSKEAVARFYTDVVASMPERVRVVVDDITTGDECKAGVMWHMEVDGTPVPCSRGLSFYRVAPPRLHSAAAAAGLPYRGRGRITYVRQSPEHFVKMSGLVLSATASATPIIDSLGPMALPDFWSNLARGASNVLATAPPVGDMLMSLAAAGASPTPAAATAAAGAMFSTMPARQAPSGGSVSSGTVNTAYAHGFVDVTGSDRSAAAPSPISAGRSAAFAAAASAVASATAAATATTPHASPSRSPPVVHAAAVFVDGEAFAGPSAASPAASRSTAAAPAHKQPAIEVAASAVSRAASAGPTGAASVMEPGATSAASVMDSEDPVPAPVPAVSVSSLAGIWEKDLEASDVAGYEKALDLWQISGVQKATARLIEGLELASSGSGPGASFNVHFLTIIPYFKVTESYPLGGRPAKMRRRDQRSGDALAHAELLSNGVVCKASWPAPFAGQLEESYTLPDPVGQPDLLHVSSTITVGDRAATTLQVYHRRRDMSARELISASEQRNGKANDVLRRFGM